MPTRLVHAMDFAGQLAALMAQHGLGVRAVARRVPCDPALISRLIHGRRQPSEKMARLLDGVLGAGGELAALASRALPVPGLAVPGLAPDPDLHARIKRAALCTGRADDSVTEWLERCLDAHRRLEDTTGSAPLLGVVGEQLRIVAGLARGTDGPSRDRLVSLAAQYAQFMAWPRSAGHTGATGHGTGPAWPGHWPTPGTLSRPPPWRSSTPGTLPPWTPTRSKAWTASARS